VVIAKHAIHQQAKLLMVTSCEDASLEPLDRVICIAFDLENDMSREGLFMGLEIGDPCSFQSSASNSTSKACNHNACSCGDAIMASRSIGSSLVVTSKLVKVVEEYAAIS
jgi:hypothetical protein